MDDKLVTIASFATPIEADLMKLAIEQEGIAVCLEDEIMARALWHMSNAMHGVKVLVKTADVERAMHVIAKLNQNISPADEDSQEVIEDSVVNSEDYDVDDEPEVIPTQRELNADRAFRGAIIGVLMQPLQLYVAWLLLKVLFSSQPIHQPHIRRAIIATVICTLILLGYFVLIYAKFRS